MSNEPTFDLEQQYWEQGIGLIAGIDEAGMGALAGPVVAAATIWDRRMTNDHFPIFNELIRDSKKLTASQREKAAAWIKDNALAWVVGEASVEEITELNIRGASHLAMRRAVDGLAHRPDMLLLDGTPATPHAEIPAVNVIKGDSISLSIAAASILAKTHRDKLMVELDEKFPGYGFASHKGYGAPVHKAAMIELGVTPHHRPTYAPVAALLA